MKHLLALAVASTSLVGCLDSAPDEPSAPSVVATDLNGDTWTTVDDNPYTAGKGMAFQSVAVAPNGHVWVVGWRTESNFDETWIVRDSTNGGASFDFNSSFGFAGGHFSVAMGVSVDSAGRIFVTGWADDSAGTSHWITRRSSDDGATWTTVDDWSPSGATVTATSVAIDDNDTIFIGGGGDDANGDTFWKVRVSTDHGATWSQQDFVDQGPDDGIGGAVLGLCFNSGDLWSVGSRPIAHDTDGLVVRDSSTGVNKEVNNSAWQANGCGGHGGTDPLYVAGQTIPQPSFDAHWIIQRSAGGGALTTVDDLSAGAGEDITAAFAVHAGEDGTIFAAGVVGREWRVRKTSDGTTWVNSDEFSLSSSSSDFAQAQAFKYWPATDHTFVVGFATVNGREHGIVRRN